jgi:hypothetical protein
MRVKYVKYNTPIWQNGIEVWDISSWGATLKDKSV